MEPAPEGPNQEQPHSQEQSSSGAHDGGEGGGRGGGGGGGGGDGGGDGGGGDGGGGDGGGDGGGASQLKPSPPYPAPHVQLYPPSKLVQKAHSWQALLLLEAHSSMSTQCVPLPA